jgi:uncharacterized surface protein with fasciclin (FAS1) repeats
MKQRTPLRVLGVAVLSLAVSVAAVGGTAVAGEKAKTPKTVVAVAKSSDDFTTLVTAVTAADLVKTLKSKGPFTVFAPDNAAFAEIPEADLNALLEDPDALASILTYHVIEGRVLAKDLQPTQTVKTVQGEELTITVNDDGTATITDANGNVVNITATDLKARNGVVHAIDGVLQPAA